LINGKTSSSAKSGKSASETFQLVKQTYSEEALRRSVVFKRHRSFAQGRDSSEDDKRTFWPRTFRTELKIQEFSTFMRANRSHVVDKVTVTAGISYDSCHEILSDDLNISDITQNSVPPVMTQDQREDRMSTCGNLIDSADNDGIFLNRIIICNMFSVRSATEATMDHLQTVIIAKKEETTTGQVKGKGDA
jgi:hypothetical protein